MSESAIHASSVVTNCTIGKNVSIGPSCFITDSTIGDNVIIEGSARIEKSRLESEVSLLWGSIIRESLIASGCVIGCEVKKSELGKYNKAKHPGTSIINAKTGEKVNFGGGFKCANYDGVGKGHFTIGSRVFFGCNSVISVKANQITSIHDGVKIGANVHVGVDIPADSLVYIDKDSGRVTVREGYLTKK